MLLTLESLCKIGYRLDGVYFGEKVQDFLRKCAERQTDIGPGKRAWRAYLGLESRSDSVPLYIMEEKVGKDDSKPSYCHHCCFTGWSNNFVTSHKYHFVIPMANEHWNRELDNVYNTKHILHGLIHFNGYGHLISIKGIDGGSQFLTGRQIMSIWDALCKSLLVRKMSVRDLSLKHQINTKLILGIAYQKSWFGDWSYEFNRGSFGTTQQNYMDSSRFLKNLNLDQMIQWFMERDETTAWILFEMALIHREQGVDPDTLGALLRLASPIDVNTLIQQNPHDNFSPKQLKKAINVIKNVLKEARDKRESPLTRTELKSRAKSIYSHEQLFNYILSHWMHNTKVDSVIIRRTRPDKEYQFSIVEGLTYEDIKFLQDVILSHYPDAKKIVDSKIFLKEWKYDKQGKDKEKIYLVCQLQIPTLLEGTGELLLHVPSRSTILELKAVVLRAVRDTYGYGMTSVYQVQFDGPLSNLGDEMKLLEGIKCGVGFSALLNVVENQRELKVEGAGLQGKTVDCETCGTKEEDGEEMVLCPCGVKKHKQCSEDGIFICPNCRNNIFV